MWHPTWSLPPLLPDVDESSEPLLPPVFYPTHFHRQNDPDARSTIVFARRLTLQDSLVKKERRQSWARNAQRGWQLHENRWWRMLQAYKFYRDGAVSLSQSTKCDMLKFWRNVRMSCRLYNALGVYLLRCFIGPKVWLHQRHLFDKRSSKRLCLDWSARILPPKSYLPPWQALSSPQVDADTVG